MTTLQPSIEDAFFTLDNSDLETAVDLGLLRADVSIDQSDPRADSFGVAYDRMRNLAQDLHGTQKAVQARCKAFAMNCGFQLYVEGNSIKPDSTGNTKYACKILNGQFYDTTTSFDALQCLFYINVSGDAGGWKITRANFCHNHHKHVGFTKQPCEEGNLAVFGGAKRNRTLQASKIKALVQQEMLPAHNRTVETMSGNAVQKFLLSNGVPTGKSSVSPVV